MNLKNFKSTYGTQKQCLDYLVTLHWPDNIHCLNPTCRGYNERKKKSYQLNDKYLFRCGRCRGQYSVTSGTLFQDTQYKMIPLWFRAIWYITSQESGTSALALQKSLGLGSYRTAWTWLQKLRQVMVNPEQDKLQGTVIVDNFSIMVKDDDFFDEKYSVLIAVEYNEKTISRIRMSNDVAIPSNIKAFVRDCVKPEGTIISDQSNVYDGLSELGYALKAEPKIKKGNHNVLPPVYDVISYLEEKKLLGRLPSLCSEDNLAYYLNECCFKFNKRNSKDTWFDDLLLNAVNSKPIQKIK